MNEIDISVLVTTKNEEDNIARCLNSLKNFSQIIVIDSHSTDRTCEISKNTGAEVVLYRWDGKYPKKRQWCLDSLNIKNDWVFWIDADEVITEECIDEIRDLFAISRTESGFFVRSSYVWNDSILRYGMKNNKLALINRTKMEFPVVDDLNIDGMGEIEGHYQPVRRSGCAEYSIGQLSCQLIHHAYDNEAEWNARHIRYAQWEAVMTLNDSWPDDPVLWRQIVKRHLRASFMRPYIVFVFSYLVKAGFLDGGAGYSFAVSRKRYCDMIYRNIRLFKNR
ncbi:MAG: glycosyltransferase family 2 protein [Alphaproteobacteria bacterium]